MHHQPTSSGAVESVSWFAQCLVPPIELETTRGHVTASRCQLRPLTTTRAVMNHFFSPGAGYQLWSAARTRISLTATRRSRVTMWETASAMSSGRSASIDSTWLRGARRTSSRRWETSSVSTVPGSTTLTRTRFVISSWRKRLGEGGDAELGEAVDAAARRTRVLPHRRGSSRRDRRAGRGAARPTPPSRSRRQAAAQWRLHSRCSLR
jgi:hypothetical protein